MAVVLAQFMVKFGGVSKEKITILVAYLSQKKVVRKFLMKSGLLDVKCTSIDEYQVSLFSHIIYNTFFYLKLNEMFS